ncbi:MAG: ribosome hibernation-promoting factor, HPF/YfiA family [Terriglobia bacterium]
MHIEYTGRQMEVTPDLREYTEEHLGKLNRVLRDNCAVHVILEGAKHRRIAEITVQWRDRTLVAIEETTDSRSSIKGALDKLERQAVRLPARLRTKKRRAAPTSAVTLNVMMPERKADEDRKVITTRRIPIKPLTIEEAIESLGADSREPAVFRNVQTDRVNVVYRHADGQLILIEPEP